MNDDGRIVYVNPNAPTRRFWLVYDAWSIIGHALGEGCGRACDYVSEFGFVPEADCPIHDSNLRRHKYAVRVVRWFVGRRGRRS